MRYLAIIFLLVLGDQSLACSMDMDWVWEHDINLAGLQADCSTYETRNYRVMEGFLLDRPGCSCLQFAGPCQFPSGIRFHRKKREQRSIRALIRISPMQLFDLVLAILICHCLVYCDMGRIHDEWSNFNLLSNIYLLRFPVVQLLLAFTARLLSLNFLEYLILSVRYLFPF